MWEGKAAQAINTIFSMKMYFDLRPRGWCTFFVIGFVIYYDDEKLNKNTQFI